MRRWIRRGLAPAAALVVCACFAPVASAVVDPYRYWNGTITIEGHDRRDNGFTDPVSGRMTEETDWSMSGVIIGPDFQPGQLFPGIIDSPGAVLQITSFGYRRHTHQ